MNIPSYVAQRTRKWNRVIDFASGTCGSTAAIYFEALRPAAGKALITLLSFGLDDVARGFFRPKGIYKQKHGGRRKRGSRVHGIPELGEEIGKRIPGASDIKARQFGAVEKSLWLADGFAQRIFFWLMVGDVLTDFFYDFATGIMTNDPGAQIGRAQFRRKGDTAKTVGGPTPSWQWVDVGATECASLIQGDFQGQVQTLGIGQCQIMTHWTLRNDFEPAQPVGIRMSGDVPGQRVEQIVSVPAGPAIPITLSANWRTRNVLLQLVPQPGDNTVHAELKMFSLIGMTKMTA